MFFLRSVLLALSACAFLNGHVLAVENVKVHSEVKMVYQTSDVELRRGEKASTGLFDNGNKTPLAVSPYNASSAGGFGAIVGVSADLLPSFNGAAELQLYSALGLDRAIFNDNSVNAEYGSTGFTDDFDNRTRTLGQISQLSFGLAIANSTLKGGRMEIDTPLLFTEKWNVNKNTFEAVTVNNRDLPDTLITAAWVGRHNGHGSAQGEGGNLLAGSPGRTVNMSAFRTLYESGAYTVGVMNQSLPATTLQAWYFNVEDFSKAYWLQADTKLANKLMLGFQYAQLNPEHFNHSNIYAAKAAIDFAGANWYVAYSSAQSNGILGFSNFSTADKTKIYTGEDSIFFDGSVTAPGVDTVKLGVSTHFNQVKFAAAYLNIRDKYHDRVEGFDFSASTKLGAWGISGIYTVVSNGADMIATSTAYGQKVGAILTPASPGSPFYKGRDMDTLRLVVTYKF